MMKHETHIQTNMPSLVGIASSVIAVSPWLQWTSSTSTSPAAGPARSLTPEKPVSNLEEHS